MEEKVKYFVSGSHQTFYIVIEAMRGLMLRTV